MGPPPAVQTQGFFTCGAKATSSSWRGHFGRASGRGDSAEANTSKEDPDRLTGVVLGSWGPAGSHSSI